MIYNTELQLILSETQLIEEYSCECLLGKGSYSEVLKCRNLKSGELVAIKIINKLGVKKSSLEMLMREAELLSQLNHQNIVQLIDYRDSSSKFYIIMELVEGMNLDDFVNQKNYSDEVIINIIKQIASALEYIHSQNIVHRDLKPQNIVINQQNQIKLIDFGLSYKKPLSNILSIQKCGTLAYIAPEILTLKAYNQKVDIWSLGIIQYYLYSRGEHPLWNSNDNKITFLKKLCTKNLNDIEFPEIMNKSARHFFLKTVSRQPEDRLSSSQVLEHPWIQGKQFSHSLMTMNDFIKQFENQKKLQNLIQSLIMVILFKEKAPEKEIVQYNNCEKKIEIDILKSENIRKTSIQNNRVPLSHIRLKSEIIDYQLKSFRVNLISSSRIKRTNTPIQYNMGKQSNQSPLKQKINSNFFEYFDKKGKTKERNKINLITQPKSSNLVTNNSKQFFGRNEGQMRRISTPLITLTSSNSPLKQYQLSPFKNRKFQ